MPDSAFQALMALKGIGSADDPRRDLYASVDPTPSMMDAAPTPGAMPFGFMPNSVALQPAAFMGARPTAPTTLPGGTSMLPANPPLPPPRPGGLLGGAPASDDDDDSAPTPAAPGPAAPPAPAAPAAPAGPGPAPAMQAPPAASPTTAGPGAATAAPDFMAMYQKLMDSNERKANFNSGLALIAGGLSGSETGRAALYNMAAQSGGQNSSAQAASTIQTLMQLRQFSQAATAKTTQQSRLPAIADQLKLPLSTVQYLDQAGKLDDLVTKAAEPNMEIKTLNDGRTVLINKQNGQVAQDFGGQKDDDKDPKQIALLNSMRDNWQKLPGVPDPSSTAPNDVQWWKDQSSRILGGGNGVSVNVNNTPEKAREQAIGQGVGGAIGKEAGEYVADGAPALKQIQMLDTMRGALKASNGQYTGPFADYVLNGKQALAGAFGVDVNAAPQETAQKLGFQLATQASKAISARPSQAEFLRALQNVPGIFQTPQGADALISITKQDAQDRVALSNLAHDPKNASNMNEVARQYYATHPIMSPFNPGESFGQNDMNLIAQAAKDGGQRGAEDFIKPMPKVSAIQALKADPSKAADFDAHFGAGMSYHYLHGAQ